MALLQIPSETRMLCEFVAWQTFVDLADSKNGSVPRLTYDDGVLELMSPGRQHENIGRLVGRIIETYSEVREIEIQSVASTTFKRSDLKKAFEADESYYIEHAELIRPKPDVDLAIDPPPDLVIEVEITASAIAKLKLFAAMGVPEVWRHNGERLEMFRLDGDLYAPISSSVCLPGLMLDEVNSLLDKRFDFGETAMIREFRQSIQRI